MIIRHNLFVGVESQGSMKYQQTQIVNNTFVNCSRSAFANSTMNSPIAFVMSPNIHGSPINSVVNNNAFVGCGRLPDTKGEMGWYNVDRSNAVPDFNFVAGPAAEGYPAKAQFAGVEAHGINGGDPKFQNINDPLGPDGVPFTLDDGLKPLPTSLLCGNGLGGTDIGAYSCDPAKVFRDTLDVQPPTDFKATVQ
jgi:hypothetical protein